MNAKTSGLVLAGMMFTSLAASAAGLPAGYPAQFQRTGIIDFVPKKPGELIVINDASYQLSAGVLVHTPLLKNASGAVLRDKQKVGFSVSAGTPEAKGTVSEVWVLPNDFKFGKNKPESDR